MFLAQRLHGSRPAARHPIPPALLRESQPRPAEFPSRPVEQEQLQPRVGDLTELMFLLSTRAGPPWPLHQRATWSTRRWKRSPSTRDPFHENQNCIANNESNGLDIATALLLEFKNNTLASWWTWSVGATTKRPSFTKAALKKSRPVTFTFCANNYWPSTTRTWPLR